MSNLQAAPEGEGEAYPSMGPPTLTTDMIAQEQLEDDVGSFTVHLNLLGPDYNGMADLDMLITVNTSLRWEDLLTIAMRYRLLGDGENVMLSGGDYDGDRFEIIMVQSEDLVENATGMGGDGDESDGTTMEPCQQTNLARSDGL